MKSNITFFALCALLFPAVTNAATCSRANLTRCLDSVCATGISSNPSARCQYCGTPDAGTPPKNVMRGITVGQSAKYVIGDKQLKSAPSDPGARYVWGTQECIKKVSGCTADDVTDTYDKLIEQSCTAAGISAGFQDFRESSSKTRSKSDCRTDITSCIISETKCDAGFMSCESNTDFDKFFAACAVNAAGCDDHLSFIRDELIMQRDTNIKNADLLLENIVNSYKSERERKINSAASSCTDNAGRLACVRSVCERSMANKCAPGYESEMSIATLLCEFHDVACEELD